MTSTSTTSTAWSEEEDEVPFAPTKSLLRTPSQQSSKANNPPAGPEKREKRANNFMIRVMEKPKSIETEKENNANSEENTQTIINMMENAMETLSAQKTRGEPAEVRDEVLKQMEAIVQQVKKLGKQAPKHKKMESTTHASSQEQNRLDNMERDIKAIKEALQNTTKSWAQVAQTAATHTATNTQQQKAQELKEERQRRSTEQRQEKKKYEVILTTETTTETTKQAIAIANEGEITARCQEAIERTEMNTPKPQLRGITKLRSGDIRIRAETEEEAEKLKEVKWSIAYRGLATHKTKYGVVIHGVPIDEINPNKDPEAAIAQLEKENEGRGIKILKIASLSKKTAMRPATTQQSIVIHMSQLEAANKSIRAGIYFNQRMYAAEQYAPQYKIKQCYNCHEYGHQAFQCKRKEKCGKCGDKEHHTSACESDEHKCIGCGGKHAAWHHECPRRREESKRLAEIKRQLSPYFHE